MAINPFRKGGNDTLPISEGGTGSTTGPNALTNIGGLNTSAHALINHTGIPGVGTVYELIERKEFLADTASYSFAGLDGNIDKVYILQGSILSGAGAGNSLVYVKPNGLALGGSFTGSYGEFNGNLFTTGPVTGFWFSVASTNFPDLPTQVEARLDANFSAPGGTAQRRRYKATINYHFGFEQVSATWNEKTVNITSLLIDATTNIIGAGSVISLYRAPDWG